MKQTLAAVVAVAVLGSASAGAHHSYAAYQTTLIEFEGVLEKVEWINPHSLLTVKTVDATYIVEWRAVNQMQRTGNTMETLKQGDRVVIKGQPHRDIAQNGIVNLRTIQRPADGWSWPAR